MTHARARRYTFPGLLVGLLALASGCHDGTPDFEPILAAEDERQVDASALRDGQSASDARLRARAAVAYGRMAQAAAIDPLVGLVGDGDAQVRRAAAFALGQLGWFDARLGHEAQLVAALTPLLADDDPGVRSRAIGAIGKLADPATATGLATPLVHDPDAQVRAEAALAVHRCRQLARARDAMAMPPPLTDDALAALRTLAADGVVEARRAAIYYFARNLDARALDLAQTLVADSDVWVRLYAVMALRRIADAGALPALVRAAADADYTVRVAAVQAVGALMRADQLPATLASDPSLHVRAALATAYGQSPQVDEKSILQLWTADPSITVRASALAALASRRTTTAAPLLMTALGDPSPEIRATAVSSAAVLTAGSAEAAVLLQTGLGDPTTRVRVAALELLGDGTDAWAYAAIKTALGAPDLAERGTAAGVLAARQESDRVAVAWQAYLASSDHRWRDARTALLDVLAGDPGPDKTVSSQHLRLAAMDPERSVAVHARQLLAARGITDLPPLPPENFAYSPFRKLRFAKNPVVTLTTVHGSFDVECFAADAPVHVASFIGLTRLRTYDGLPWHRVVSDFVVQGGDPEGTGWGDAGFSLRAEINEQRFERGALGMPRGDDFDTGGAQLFFNHIQTPHLDGQYTVFGQIRNGTAVVDQIEQGDLILSARVVE
jgi:cyclophilin family peptidyl-prolyl cis-trans isomerase/HEAT repeat protein